MKPERSASDEFHPATSVPSEREEGGAYPAANEFQLHASMLEAIEGGPLAIKVTLKYCGDRPRRVHYPLSSARRAFIDDMSSRGWTRLKVYGGHGIINSFIYMSPGEESSEIHYLHHRIEHLSPGWRKFRISWPVRASKPPSEYIACPETFLEVFIQPADRKHLSSLRQRLKSRLDEVLQAGDVEGVSELANYVVKTNHAALAPIAWQIIERSHKEILPYEMTRSLANYSADHSEADLLCFVAEYSDNLPEADFRLAKRMNDFGVPARLALSRCWASRKPPISPDAFRILLQSNRIWTRVITYAAFSKLCDQRWVNKLLTDLPKVTQPLPPPQFARLLQDLDDDVFSVRERATSRLASLGEGVETQLKDALKNPLSPEAKRRIRLILEKISTDKASPEWKPIMEDLRRQHTPAAQAILHALANGAANAEMTKAAATFLKASP